MCNSWAKEFPRLYELFSDSAQASTTNYFKEFEEHLQYQDRKDVYIKVEQELQQIDPHSWSTLKQKAVNYVAAYDKSRAWQQLFNMLNERFGYLYLKSKGHERIRFIAEEGNRRTPDIIAFRGKAVTLLEVKTINPSDNETTWIRDNSRTDTPGMTAREVSHNIEGAFVGKISTTVDSAKEQLYACNCSDVKQRIVYLVIKPDIGYKLNNSIRNEMVDYIKQLRIDKEVGIVPFILDY